MLHSFAMLVTSDKKNKEEKCYQLSMPDKEEPPRCRFRFRFRFRFLSLLNGR